ncbi:hypothetical protein SS50377_23654 [Spironucleus salmonicida]|uniref:Uncharacterized protein n=1 Tax=Spironucleus salmonicida TaxID=348837 RepID=V6LVG0_9EUKA|nr:hypothetical protein SS50377_23654 [Spironucleus salmonicida]|eukprot:EST48637.1 hypothetical protein SS50377_11250 [Spironucleus salmonicida]
MSIEKYSLEHPTKINSPRSFIAMDRLGITEQMIQPPTQLSYKLTVGDDDIAEKGYYMKLAEVQEYVSDLKQEFINIKQNGILFEEYLIQKENPLLQDLVRADSVDYSLKQSDFKIISNEEAQRRRCEQEKAFKDEMEKAQQERLRKNHEIEIKRAERIQQLAVEREAHAIQEREKQAKILADKQAFAKSQLERNFQLQKSMRDKDEHLRQQKLEQHRQIQSQAAHERRLQEERKKELEIQQQKEQKRKFQEFREQTLRAEQQEKERQKRLIEEQRLKEQANRMKQLEAVKKQEEIRQLFKQKQRENELAFKEKMKVADANIQSKNYQIFEKASQLKLKYDVKTENAKILIDQAERQRHAQLQSSLDDTYEKMRKADEIKRQREKELLMSAVEKQFQFEHKTNNSEQYKRKKEYQAKLKGVKTQHKLNVVDQMQQERDFVRNQNVQLSVKLDSLKTLPEHERQQREAEIMRNMASTTGKASQAASSQKVRPASASRKVIDISSPQNPVSQENPKQTDLLKEDVLKIEELKE